MQHRILYYSLTDWADIKQRSQHLAELLAERHEIVFLHPRSVGQAFWLARWSSTVDLRRVVRHGSGLTILSPWVLPLSRFAPIRLANRRLFRLQVAAFLARENFCPDIIWMTFPDQIDDLPDNCTARIVYDCMDDFPLFYAEPRRSTLRAREAVTIARADVVLASSEALFRKCQALNQSVHLVRNGVRAADFACTGDIPTPPELKSIRHPILGYYGSVARWLDWRLLLEVAAQEGSWSFVFIGPGEAPSPHPSNMHFLGPKPYAALPQYLSAFDVAILPFEVNDITVSVDPLKVYEYMAAGKPVVASRLPALRAHAGCLEFYDDRASFRSAVGRCLVDYPASQRQKMRQIALQNDWSVRAAHVESVLDRLDETLIPPKFL